MATEQEDHQASTTEDLHARVASVAAREATELAPYPSTATERSARTASQYQGHFGSIRKYWRRHVSLAVPHVKSRDHLGV